MHSTEGILRIRPVTNYGPYVRLRPLRAGLKDAIIRCRQAPPFAAIAAPPRGARLSLQFNQIFRGPSGLQTAG